MILYHTGNKDIRLPDIRHGRKNADFGQGFYLSPDRDFIYRWAGKDAVVNEYELDESGLLVRKFVRDEEWFHYIYLNRRGQDGLEADVIMGPIANDTIFDTMGILSSGFLAADKALQLLLVGPEYMQVAIKSDKAAAALRWVKAEHIEKISSADHRAEEEAYQTALAEEMNRIL